jgi:hypothetical protein
MECSHSLYRLVKAQIFSHFLKINFYDEAQWFTPIIPAFRRQRQEDYEFEISLGYVAKLSKKKIHTQKKLSILGFQKNCKGSAKVPSYISYKLLEGLKFHAFSQSILFLILTNLSWLSLIFSRRSPDIKFPFSTWHYW